MRRCILTVIILALIALFTAACSAESEVIGKTEIVEIGKGVVKETANDLNGMIEIDGSSTVYLVSEAVAEEFRKSYSKVQVNVGVSGTGGGFKRFAVGETDICDASRPIKDKERETAEENGIEYHELMVGRDGLSVVVNKNNDWATCMTVPELRMLWEPGSEVSRWSDIRSGWPDHRINLYGPGTDSGTFDFFTQEIVGEIQASRSDFTMSEDDNVLVIGVNGDKGALGYFGYAYYVENMDKLNIVAIDGGDGCILPNPETILNGQYKPLSRPLFIYVSKDSLKRPEVQAFVEYYMSNASQLVSEIGYIRLSDEEYLTNLAKIR